MTFEEARRTVRWILENSREKSDVELAAELVRLYNFDHKAAAYDTLKKAYDDRQAELSRLEKENRDLKQKIQEMQKAMDDAMEEGLTDFPHADYKSKKIP